MTKYHISYQNPSDHYIDITATFPSAQKEQLVLQLAAWRPGRYELGNFAKNIQKVWAYNADGIPLPIQKTGKDTWLVESHGAQTIHIRYRYYAADLNAGSTWLGQDQLYMNPVNCLIYAPELMHLAHHLELSVPDNYTIACGLHRQDKTLFAADFHELADNPFIASPTIRHHLLNACGYPIHLWMQGEAKLDMDRVARDFTAFMEAQIRAFGDMPVPEFHFMFQFKPVSDYHGVEHKTSTVCVIGPSHALMKDYYVELLGLSSHEFYHLWNIKTIRPAEMHPYDYTRENYSRLGYVAEGVTTYMGDLMLFRSGVFNTAQYLNELSKLVNRHVENYGRFNYSIAESSFDTWLDGYVPGTPWRKVSIYTEGALLALATEVIIMQQTGNAKRLDTVMHRLYHEYAKKGIGYTEADYQREVEIAAGIDLAAFFSTYIYQPAPLDSLTHETLDYLGLKMVEEPAMRASERMLGLKTMGSPLGDEVRIFAPGSPAHIAGLSIGDIIVAVNGVISRSNLDAWLDYFKLEPLTLGIERGGRQLQLSIHPDGTNWYSTFRVQEQENSTTVQKEAMRVWKMG